jgi:hypothetical protein
MTGLAVLATIFLFTGTALGLGLCRMVRLQEGRCDMGRDADSAALRFPSH